MQIKDFIFGCGILGTVIAFPTVAKSLEIYTNERWKKQIHASHNN